MGKRAARRRRRTIEQGPPDFQVEEAKRIEDERRRRIAQETAQRAFNAAGNYAKQNRRLQELLNGTADQQHDIIEGATRTARAYHRAVILEQLARAENPPLEWGSDEMDALLGEEREQVRRSGGCDRIAFAHSREQLRRLNRGLPPYAIANALPENTRRKVRKALGLPIFLIILGIGGAIAYQINNLNPNTPRINSKISLAS